MLIKRIGALALYGYFSVFVIITMGLAVYWHYMKSEPKQPLTFPHDVHVTTVGLECQFCHESVDRSRSAGVPSVEKCLGCHKAVATDKPRIQTLTKYWEQKKPIEWSRLHKVPDFVHFSHERHVKKDIPCQTCHGEVQHMEQVKKVRSLTMGWCVSCHRENNASTDCVTCHK